MGRAEIWKLTGSMAGMGKMSKNNQVDAIRVDNGAAEVKFDLGVVLSDIRRWDGKCVLCLFEINKCEAGNKASTYN